MRLSGLCSTAMLISTSLCLSIAHTALLSKRTNAWDATYAMPGSFNDACTTSDFVDHTNTSADSALTKDCKAIADHYRDPNHSTTWYFESRAYKDQVAIELAHVGTCWFRVYPIIAAQGGWADPATGVGWKEVIFGSDDLADLVSDAIAKFGRGGDGLVATSGTTLCRVLVPYNGNTNYVSKVYWEVFTPH